MITMLLKDLIDNGINIFSFDYNFYGDADAKASFEQKFVDHYYFREIGAETPERFLFYLESTIKEIMPYYHQLYLTTIQKYDMIENYNLTETITNNRTGTNSVNGESKNFDTPITKNNDYTKSPSFVNTTTGGGTANSTENTTRNTKGNIGVASSQDLIMKQRDIIINIDFILIDELNKLFLGVWE